MSDLISRQTAIDFIDAGHLCNPNEPRWSDNEVVNFLRSRPSAQPRPRGRWVPNYIYHYEDRFVCTACGRSYKVDTRMGKPIWDFCPNCGADMRGEQDERSN